MFRQAKQDLPDGIYIRLRTDVFNLRRLLARTKTIKELITELLFADDCALLATTKCLRAFSPSEWGMQVYSDVTSIVNKYLGSKLGVWLMSSMRLRA